MRRNIKYWLGFLLVGGVLTSFLIVNQIVLRNSKPASIIISNDQTNIVIDQTKIKKLCDFYSCNFQNQVSFKGTDAISSAALLIGTGNNQVGFISARNGDSVLTTVFVPSNQESEPNIYKGLSIIIKYFSQTDESIQNLNQLTPDQTTELLSIILKEQPIEL